MSWKPSNERHIPITAPLSNGSMDRAPDKLVKVIEQFNVEKSPRYAGVQGLTWCNRFVSDVTRALGCEVPQWWPTGPATGVAKMLRANDMQEWLLDEGVEQGWKECKEKEAQEAAAKGQVAIVTYLNRRGSGHIAIMRPDGTIAQAGIRNFNRDSIAQGFGNVPLRFFTHP